MKNMNSKRHLIILFSFFSFILFSKAHVFADTDPCIDSDHSEYNSRLCQNTRQSDSVTEDEETSSQDEIVVESGLYIRSVFYPGWGVYVGRKNPSYVKSVFGPCEHVRDVMYQKATHFGHISDAIELLTSADKRTVYNKFSDLMSLFEYDDDLISEFKNITTTAVRKRELLIKFYTDIYPENSSQAAAAPKSEQTKMVEYRNLISQNEADAEDINESIFDLLLKSVQGERSPEVLDPTRRLSWMYTKHAGTYFTCTGP